MTTAPHEHGDQQGRKARKTASSPSWPGPDVGSLQDEPVARFSDTLSLLAVAHGALSAAQSPIGFLRHGVFRDDVEDVIQGALVRFCRTEREQRVRNPAALLTTAVKRIRIDRCRPAASRPPRRPLAESGYLIHTAHIYFPPGADRDEDGQAL